MERTERDLADSLMYISEPGRHVENCTEWFGFDEPVGAFHLQELHTDALCLLVCYCHLSSHNRLYRQMNKQIVSRTKIRKIQLLPFAVSQESRAVAGKPCDAVAIF